MGEFPTPRAKKSSKSPPPGPIKRAKISPSGHFSQLFTIKTWKKWDRNHVKLQDFIIFRWLKDKLSLQLSPAYIIGKFTLINCKTLYIFVRIYSLILLDSIRRLGSIRIKINTQKKVDKFYTTQISFCLFISSCNWTNLNTLRICTRVNGRVRINYQ